MLKGKIIYQTDTPLGPVQVGEDNQYRWISFDNEFVQTIIKKKDPLSPELLYIPSMTCVLRKNQDNILLLGAGGGAILLYLQGHYPTHAINAIELSPEMIHIAHTYFGVTHPITQACAFEYIKACAPTHHLFIDLLTGTNTPSELLTDAFYESCLEKTTFITTFNLISDNQEDVAAIFKLIRHVFQNRTLSMPVKGKNNLIIHGFKDKSYLDTITLLVKQNKIIPPLWDEYYGLMSHHQSVL